MYEAAGALVYRRLNLQRDVAALAGLLHDVAQADQTGDEVTEAGLYQQLTWSGQDPALNNWVVALEEHASLVGYAMIQKMPHDANADLHIVVHPPWRRRGIGRQLFTYLLERASELDTRALRGYVPVQDEGASLFVRLLGFEPVATYTRMRLSDIQSFPAPALPEGFTMRSYDQIEQLDLYTEAINRCYEGYWGHIQGTQEDVARFLPRFNHAGIFLLFAPDGTIAGTCRADLNEQSEDASESLTALIDAPGIVARYRDVDLALPLLLTAIHWVLRHHPATLELEAWGETPELLARYRSLGFTVTKEEISYRMNLQ